MPSLCFCVLLQDEFAVNIFEEVVRFHLLSEHELCEEEASSERRLFHVDYLLWPVLITSHVTVLPGSILHGLQSPCCAEPCMLNNAGRRRAWSPMHRRIAQQQAACPCLAVPSPCLASR